MKKIFTKNEQPLALELLGYVLCTLIGFSTIKIMGTKNFESYVMFIVFTTLVGLIYNLYLKNPEKFVSFIENTYEKFSIFLCRMAGKRGVMSPKEVTRYGVIGSTLFIPPIISFFTFPYLLQKSMDCPVGMSYLLTVPLAVVIFLVDRSFVATMGWKKIWYSVLIRVVLATTLGLFLSKPIELKIFEKETTEELKVQKQNKLNSIQKDKTQALSDLRNQEEMAMFELNRARQEYEKEINESIGGRIAGHGIEAKKKEAYFIEQQNLYKNNIQPKIEERRKEIETTFEQKKEEYISSQSEGLGARSQALDAAGKKYPAIARNAWIILISLILLDLSPLFAKMFMPRSESDSREKSEEELAEHINSLKKIERKYELMTKELSSTIEMIKKLEIKEEDIEKIVLFEKQKLQKKYFDKNSINLN